MIVEILGLFVNTLTADDRYYLVNRENLTQHIQMAFSKNQKTLSEFFSGSLKFRINFKNFQTKDDPHT